MRKIGFIILLLGLSVITLSGCEKNGTSNGATGQATTEEQTTTGETDTDVMEPDGETEVPTDSEETDGTKEVTDTAIIQGMAKDILANMTVEEKVGQLFVVNLELLDPTKGNYYEYREITPKMKRMLARYHVGGVVLFSRNIESREQTMKLLTDLQANSKFPLFTTVDEEGGDVARIASNDNMMTTKFPPMEEIGATEDAEYAKTVGTTIGKEIKALGFNVDFAPVADVRTNDLNTEIGNRSFGSDPKLVAKMVKNVVAGLQEQNVSATLKHFPGHGDAASDSHEGAVNVENDIARLRDVEFVPFTAGIKAGADFIMVSHISISQVTEDVVPASLSSLVYDQILRQELGFEGIAITDALNMKAITDQYDAKQAAVKAILAGADLLLMPENFLDAYHAVLVAAKDGTISEERLNESVTRILELKVKRSIIPQDTTLIPTEATE